MKKSMCAVLAGLMLNVPLLAHSQEHNATEFAGRGIVSLWNKTWGVEVYLPGFHIEINDVTPDGGRFVQFSNDTAGLMASLTLTDLPSKLSKYACHDVFRDMIRRPSIVETAARMKKKNIKTWQTADSAFLEFTVPSMRRRGKQRVDVNLQNRLVCFQHEDVLVDLHVSKLDFQPGEEHLFDPILDSLKIYEGLTRTSMDYFQAGTSYFLQSDFKRAVPPYAQALALEQDGPQLKKNSGTC